MTALIGFVRELGAELVRRADLIDAEGKNMPNVTQLEHDAMVVTLATATVLRQVGESIAVAAKRTLFA